jgi:hypothetical protein
VTDTLKFFGTSRTETAAERSYRSFRSAQRAREVLDLVRIGARRKLDLGDARFDGLDAQRREDGGRTGDEEDADASAQLSHDHGGAEMSGAL